MRKSAYFFSVVVSVLLPLLMLGCQDEPGRVRAKRSDLVGVYETAFDHGRERLELKTDGTYVQEYRAGDRSFHHTGKWMLNSHIFDGSDVELLDVNLSEDLLDKSEHIGGRTLNVHSHSGRFVLALNETADWYFERVQ